jgi:C4-dicarboxylate transporter, DctQ subunit
MVKRILGYLDRILTFFEEWSLFISVFVALVAMFFNVVLRYGFNYSLAWSEELVREVIIFTTFIGCSAAVKRNSMIKIDASVQIFPKLKIPLTFFSHLATLIFSFMLVYYGWLMAVMQVKTHQKTIILQIPLVYLYAILPITGVMMFIRTIQVVHHDLQQIRGSD